MHHQIKKHTIIFIVISFIFFNAWSSQPCQDTLLFVCKDLTYRDMTSLVCTNKHYNQILNAAFYTKLLQSKSPALQRQLAYDEDLFKKFYRTQVKRYMGLNEKEQQSFELSQLLHLNKSSINKLITSDIGKKYRSDRGIIRLTINNTRFSFFEKEIGLTEFTPEEQIAFFSNCPSPTKFEQAIDNLPVLMKKIETHEIEATKELLKKHNNFLIVDPVAVLDNLCKLNNYEIIKDFIKVDRTEIINKLNLLNLSTENYTSHNILDYALERAYRMNLLSLFTDLLNTTEIKFNCAKIATMVKDCINNKSIAWIRAIIKSKRNHETKHQIVNQYFTKEGYVSWRKCDNDRGLFTHACNSGIHEVIELLLPHAPEDAIEIAFESACYHKNVELAHWLLEKKNDFNSFYKHEIPLLHYLLTEPGDLDEEIIIALAKKTNITVVGPQKKTLLHLALEKNLEKLAHHLVENGADINAQDTYKKTPLHYAIGGTFDTRHSVEMIEFLLKNCADPNIVDNQERSAFSYAFSYPPAEQKQVMALLINKDANIHYKCNEEKTALHDACRNKCSIEILQFLIDNKLDINAQDSHGNTPLHYSCNSLEIAHFLLANGADINKPNYEGKNPLDRCNRGCYEGYCDWDLNERSPLPIGIIELFVQNGANIFYTMQKPYDQIACICLLPEDKETVNIIEKLFTQLEQKDTKDKKIDILITLAQRNQNSQTIDFLTQQKSILNAPPALPKHNSETHLKEQLNLLLELDFFLDNLHIPTDPPAQIKSTQKDNPKKTPDIVSTHAEIHTQPDTTQPHKKTTLQKYALYLCMPLIGGTLLFLAKIFLDGTLTIQDLFPTKLFTY